MIIVTLMGGMGNQMFQYAFGRALALEHKMELKLDLSMLHNCFNEKITKREFALNDFGLSFEYATEEELQFFNTRPGNFANKFNLFLALMGISPVRKMRVWGYFQGEKYFCKHKDTIRSDFKFQPLTHENELKYEKMIQDSKNSVAIHVRRGDYAGQPIHDVCNKDYFKRAIKLMREKVDAPEFFLFSDDIEYSQNILNERMVPVQGCHEDDQEMYLMSMCKNFIISNSTFSWWAAWLGSHEQKLVVAPYKWFGEHKSNKKYLNKNRIILNDWIKVVFDEDIH